MHCIQLYQFCGGGAYRKGVLIGIGAFMKKILTQAGALRGHLLVGGCKIKSLSMVPLDKIANLPDLHFPTLASHWVFPCTVHMK